MSQITETVAENALSLDATKLPAATIEHAKQAVLDLIGIAARARAESDTTKIVHGVIREMSAGGKATAVAYGPQFSVQYAALLNGCSFHALDFDDTHELSSLHPGAPVIAAALPVAEQQGANGRALLAAIVAGYDVTVRLGIALRPHVHYARGFHPTATAGTFGATAAVARLRGAKPATLAKAFGINLSQAAGSLQFSADGAQTKPLQVGLAAHNAVLAERFAAAGLRGPAEAFEGRSGFLHAYSDGADAADILDNWDGVHEIDRTAFKPYPCCRYIHSAVDQLAEIVREHRLTPDAIDEVRVGLPAAGMRLVGDPEEAKRHPRSVVDKQFSMYHAAAATILWGSVRWDDYARPDDPRLARLIERIKVSNDPEIEALAPRMASKVEVHAGAVHERRVATSPRGEPDRPLEWDELIAKFNDLASVTWDAARRKRIVDNVRRLDRITDVRSFTAELGADPKVWIKL
ncbi:MAG TPA: MmgE/PrpD family protein [Xanthomonadales bacterium]|nr:MmgE/PrpD family protein [Xanthomonadales bacterium]